MRKVIGFLFLFITLNVYGQHALPVQMDTNLYRGEVVLYGVVDYCGTSLQNEMASKLIYGGFIDNEAKIASREKHKKKNIYGAEVNSEIDFRNYDALSYILKGKYGYYIRGGFGGYISGAYSDDLFGLTFFGNTDYLGDTANFSGTEINGVVFQKFGFGLVDKKMKSNFGINYYNISEFGEGFVREGQLISDSGGYDMEMILDGRFRYASGSQINKGWGIGFDMDFRFQTQWIKDKKAFFQAQFKNLGLMHINSVQEYVMDTTLNFDGFKYNQLFGDDALTVDNRDDLLDSLGLKRNETSVTALLPGFVQIGKIVDEHSTENMQSFFGVRLYTTLKYNPLIYGGVQFKAYPWMKIGVQAIYGGFSKFRIGFYTQYNYKNIFIGIGSENLIGALSKKGKGESINLRLAYRW